MYLFELGRLCALWDRPKRDRESIPTIVNLISSPGIVELAVQEMHDHFANQALPRVWNESSDPELQDLAMRTLERDRAQTAIDESGAARNRLASAISLTEAVMTGPKLRALRDFRNNHIAHNLAPRNPTEQAETSGPEHGDEIELLERTVEIADLLSLGLNGVHFSWDESRRIARRNAEALWNGCRFEVLE